MADMKKEMPETFTLLNLLEQDVFEINNIATKIEADLDNNTHIQSLANKMYTLNDQIQNNKIQEMVNFVLSCFHTAENDLSTLKRYVVRMEKRRFEIGVCLAKTLDTECEEIKQEYPDVETIRCSKRLKNKVVSINFGIDEGSGSDTDEYELENICGFNEKADAPRPRNCHLKLWPDLQDYGFNLHAEKGKPGQFIGTVDADSPAQYAGLKEGDRIIEVNGENIATEDHEDVVKKIKSDSKQTILLVLDSGAEAYYKQKEMVVSSKQSNVDHIVCPDIKPQDPPHHSSENLAEDEIQVTNKTDEGCSNENNIVVEHDINVSSIGVHEKPHVTEMHNSEKGFTHQKGLELKNNFGKHNKGLKETIKVETNIKLHRGFSRKFTCKLCKKLYSSKNHLKRHVTLFHSKIKPICREKIYRKIYPCSHCPAKFKLKTSLVEHTVKHTGNYPCLCEECGQGFTNRSRLKLHIRSKHIGERHFKCDKCEAAFVENTFLKRHMKTVHPDKNEPITTFICEVCGASFKAIGTLKRHSLIHSGVFAFKCPHCSKSFKVSEQLSRHLLTHTGEKPFKCEDCGKCFTQRTNLRVHRRGHTGEKPYICECGKAFAHRVSLKSHMKSMGGACRVLAK